MIGEYSYWAVAAFFVIIIASLVLDLVAHKKNEAISMKNAALWSVFWVLLSLAFAGYVWYSHGPEQSSLFLAGYLLEKSLSVDNLFVFMAVFSSFAVRDEYQHRVLYYGIIGALVMRMVFIAAGTAVLHIFEFWALTIFGMFVLWTAWKMWQESRKEEREIEDYSHHWSVRLVGRVFPVLPSMRGERFFVREKGRLFCTPLFLCLVVIEVADVMFAFDSVPAVIAITREPFLVYTSNIFAILGLRSLYFLLAAARRYLRFLEDAVVVILAFIGVKLLLDVSGLFEISPTHSLIIVFSILSVGIAVSILFPSKENEKLGPKPIRDDSCDT